MSSAGQEKVNCDTPTPRLWEGRTEGKRRGQVTCTRLLSWGRELGRELGREQVAWFLCA